MDIGYQYKTLEVLKGLGLTIIAAIHDLSLAMKFCDEVVLINGGEVVEVGNPKDIIDEKVLKNIFKINAKIIKTEEKIVNRLYKFLLLGGDFIFIQQGSAHIFKRFRKQNFKSHFLTANNNAVFIGNIGLPEYFNKRAAKVYADRKSLCIHAYMLYTYPTYSD